MSDYPWYEVPKPGEPQCEADGTREGPNGGDHYWSCTAPGTVDVDGTLMCEDHAGERGYGPKQEEYGFDPHDGLNSPRCQGRRPPPMTGTTAPGHTYNWTCFLVSSHSVPRDDDAPECQACRPQVTRGAVATGRTATARWAALRAEVQQYRDAHRDHAADLEGEGKDSATAYARALELDWVLALMDRMEEGQ